MFVSPLNMCSLGMQAPVPQASASSAGGRGNYKCGKCGQPKKGHICAVASPETATIAIQVLFSSNCLEAFGPSQQPAVFIPIEYMLVSF